MTSLKCDILQHDDSSEDETEYKISDDVRSDTDDSVSDDDACSVVADSSLEMVVSSNFLTCEISKSNVLSILKRIYIFLEYSLRYSSWWVKHII